MLKYGYLKDVNVLFRFLMKSANQTKTTHKIVKCNRHFTLHNLKCVKTQFRIKQDWQNYGPP